MVNRSDDGRTDSGCGCVDVGFENPAAIRKFLFQSSTPKCFDVEGEEENNGKERLRMEGQSWIPKFVKVRLVGRESARALAALD